MELPLKVEYTRPLISIQDMVNFIDKGERYLKKASEELSEEDQLEFLQGIILSPDYQREYRSKAKEESSIIESIIVGIPIPEIFLVRTGNDGIQLRHVMDGQHRLTAIYRFIKDKFSLTDLELLKDNEKFKNKRFSQLDKEIKFKILGSHLSVLEFESFSSDDMEIELFKRYNRNTKPLERHEMSMATFYSSTSLYITNFLNHNIENIEKADMSAQLIKIYNVTSDRKNKQRNHQELCIILSIINNGPNVMYKDGVEIANKYLEERSNAYKTGSETLQAIKNEFNKFNFFMLKLAEAVEYPFSIAIFKGEDKRSTKFHTGVSMVLATIFYYFDVDLNHPLLLEDIKTIMENSPLGDDTYNASSTNMRNLMSYLYKKNKVFNRSFNALKFRNNISTDIISILEKNENGAS
ncbi:DUF262 domain-containing protein [Clostridium sp. KNHs205]|uniref:DUF262 domain-containing protein n=1 Tax=Clostridium sp. KNHs205 TaxID=1449050 RepID=UPI00051C7E1A|nr:DUF262 domain-containing protein [Clostridium sp. KNHs205]